ncbi:MAG: energy-coupling factor transporter transmembrane component T [Pelolinea sp.]|nr:energy-coupling factor transporter transmembrane component T [Pelolinea sp.]
MSDFEYLQKVTVGQYLPLGSWVHRRDPRVKFVGYALLITALTLTANLHGLLIGIAAAFLLLMLSKTPWKYALRGLLTPLPFLLILAALQLFITPHDISSVSLLKILGAGIYPEGILAGIRLLVRFCILVIILTVSSATLSTLEIIHGLELLFKPLKIFGLRTGSAAMAVQITLRFIPFLAINAEKIAKAQASRGAEWGVRKGNLLKRVRQVFPLIIPLFSNSLRQAETLADAMLARGYAGNAKRTSMVDYQITIRDWVFLLLLVSVSVLIVLIK